MAIGLFQRSEQYEEYAEIPLIEVEEAEVVYEESYEIPVSVTIDEQWDDEPDSFGLTAKDVKVLLSDESKRLINSNFVLDGIDFNPKKLSAVEALKQRQLSSISTLMTVGKLSTIVDIERKRQGEKERVERERKESETASASAEYKLSYQFSFGELSEEQKREFFEHKILPDTLVNTTPPKFDELYRAVTMEQLSAELSGKLTNYIDEKIVEDYINFWGSVSSEICNNEFGRRSYWIAAGSNWFIGEFAAELLRTAYAAGLSPAPLVSLEQLHKVYGLSHGYLNDLELFANSPRNMRDSLEQFKLFNEAHHAIYHGTVSLNKESGYTPYRYGWSTFENSKVVIVTLPSIGLVVGGMAVLIELLEARAIARLPTIIISTRSVKNLNELNAGFIPEFFGKTGAALIPTTDASLPECMGVTNFLYFSVYGDTSARSSAVAEAVKRMERKQGKKTAAKKRGSGGKGKSGSSKRSSRNKGMLKSSTRSRKAIEDDVDLSDYDAEMDAIVTARDESKAETDAAVQQLADDIKRGEAKRIKEADKAGKLSVERDAKNSAPKARTGKSAVTDRAIKAAYKQGMSISAVCRLLWPTVNSTKQKRVRQVLGELYVEPVKGSAKKIDGKLAASEVKKTENTVAVEESTINKKPVAKKPVKSKPVKSKPKHKPGVQRVTDEQILKLYKPGMTRGGMCKELGLSNAMCNYRRIERVLGDKYVPPEKIAKAK